jgi:hypothetical protein
LIEAEEFAEIFEKKLAECFSNTSSTETLEHQRLARNEIVSGSYIRRLQETSPQAAEGLESNLLLSQIQRWSPDLRISGEPEPRREAVFAVRAMPDDIEQRATLWLMQRGTPFELLLNSDLRSYTSQQQHLPTTATPTEYAKRQQKFIQQLRSAIQSAEPLVGIDQNLIGSIHPRMTDGGELRIRRDVSEIPLLSHALEGEVRTTLEQTCYGGARAGLIDDVVVASTKLPYIDVISQLDSPVSPLVVKSIMQPISNEWTQAKTSDILRGSFWANRRARRLKEFIPVPQEHLHAMIRGWFTGKLLGLIKGELGAQVEIVRNLTDPQPRWVRFPDVTLTSPMEVRDQLPVILESLPLAYAEVGTVSSLEPLSGYQALRDLGCSVPGGLNLIYQYTAPHPTLQQWIKTGQVPKADLIPNYPGPRVDIVATTESERREKLATFLKDSVDGYNKKLDEYFHRAKGDPSVLGNPPLWPSLSGEILKALEAIKGAVAAPADSSDF